jgi:hypothetical protein
MKNTSEQLEALEDIRKMMKDSSRFLSLSGLSGVLAGGYALLGAALAQQAIQTIDAGRYYASGELSQRLTLCLGSIALCVLILSVATALWLSGRKARKRGHRLFDHSSRNLLWSMAIPLLTGGIFCLSLLAHGGKAVYLICPAMLIFYGIALASSSRLTLHDVKYLGYMQIALGLTASFYPHHGLLFWSLGFGLLHIVYGSIMWFKYDRNPHR